MSNSAPLSERVCEFCHQVGTLARVARSDWYACSSCSRTVLIHNGEIVRRGVVGEPWDRARVALATVVWGYIALSVLACGGRPAPSTPAIAYPTWRCVLMNQGGTHTVKTVEMPKLFPYLVLTDCDQSGIQQVADGPRPCGALEHRRRVFRFHSLEIDSMTATYRDTEP